MLLGRRPNEMPGWHLAQLLSNDIWWSLYAYLSITAAISIHFRRTQLRRGGRRTARQACFVNTFIDSASARRI